MDGVRRLWLLWYPRASYSEASPLFVPALGIHNIYFRPSCDEPICEKRIEMIHHDAEFDQQKF